MLAESPPPPPVPDPVIATPLEALVLDGLRRLPIAQQQEVLRFIEFLLHKLFGQKPQIKPRPRRVALIGICADLGVDLSNLEEDLTIARREMWANFPRKYI